MESERVILLDCSKVDWKVLKFALRYREFFWEMGREGESFDVLSACLLI